MSGGMQNCPFGVDPMVVWCVDNGKILCYKNSTEGL